MLEVDKEQLRRIALAFDAALQQASEEEIQRVMASHADVFFPGLHSASKYKLADTYVTDFLNVRPESEAMNDPRAFAQFVEIERADYPLFTNAGDPSSKLTHAIRQVQDWKLWIRDNREYFQRQLASHLRTYSLDKYEHAEIRHGVSERYLVIIGRRHSMTVSDRMRLAQMNDDLDDIVVVTYDMLLDRIVDETRDGHRYGRWGYWSY